MAATVASSAIAAAVRRPRHVIIAAAVAGLLAGPRAPVAAAGAVAAAIVVAAGRPIAARHARLLLGASLALVAGALTADARLTALDRTALRPWLGHAAELRVVALELPRERAFGRQAVLALVQAGPGAGERVLVRAARLDPAVGRELRLRGGFRRLPGYESAARRRGAHALFDADAVIPTGRRRGGVAGALDRVRDRADRALERGLPPPLGALARGMVLGEGAALPSGVAADFQAVGLTHIVAASGANVALLVALALGIAAAAGVPLRLRLWSMLIVIAAYVPLAGGGPSIQRAGVMGAAAVVAALASTPSSRWYALLLAALATLVANPRAAEDPGWQLSFAAVIALIALLPPLRRRFARRLPAPLGELAAVTVSASVGTAPLIAAHFDRVSLVSLPVNVAAAPVVPLVMWLGTLAALAGQAGTALAAPFTALAAWPLALLLALADLGASLPYAEVRAPSLVATGAGVAGLVLLIAALGSRRCRGVCLIAIGMSIAGVVALSPLLSQRGHPRPPAGLVVSALDVGQGDATLIQHGSHAILVDAGPADGEIVRRLRDAGVRGLDALVVTHAQADHQGGAAAVLAALPVGLVLDGRDGVRSPDGDRFAAIARRRRVRLLAAAAGQRLRAGPLSLDVLSPQPARAPADAGADPNQRAVVAELRDGGFAMLLTADAESDVLASLALEPVDVLKVAHHGSADDGLPALLARLRPAVAVIEVGRSNRYGHPAPSTLAALRAVGEVARTDRDGTVRLHVEPDGIRIERDA